MTAVRQGEIALASTDGHTWNLMLCQPEQTSAALLWLPAMGVSARNYLPMARLLAERGVAVFLHEWRGLGSSSLRAGRNSDWGYREVLEWDVATSAQAARTHLDSARWIVGGHSLGGQLAACHASLFELGYSDLWLVASGTPHWRSFPAPKRYLLPGLYRFFRWLAHRNGALPGRRLGFAGIEARSLIGDWSAVGLSGRYGGANMQTDLDATLADLDIDIHGVLFHEDWLAPPQSLAGLAAKMPRASFRSHQITSERLGARADHFAWMRQPQAVIDALFPSNDDATHSR